MIVVVINTINFLQHKLQQLITLNRAQEMGKEVLDGLAERSGEAYEKDSQDTPQQQTNNSIFDFMISLLLLPLHLESH